jgi:hypothetical protein
MNLTALRIIAKGALLAGPVPVVDGRATPGLIGAAPFATMADDRVYDSAKEPWTDAIEEPLPVIVVRTDSDSAVNGNESNPTFQETSRTVNLVLQYGIWAIDQEGVLPWPVTNAQLEALLGMMGWQIKAALAGSHPWAVWFQKVFPRQNWISDSYYQDTEEGRLKLAVRGVSMTGRLAPECVPLPTRDLDPQPVPAYPPLLSDVFTRVAAEATGSFKDSVAQIKTVLDARSLPKGSAYPALKRVSAVLLEARTPPGLKPRVDMTTELLQKPTST